MPLKGIEHIEEMATRYQGGWSLPDLVKHYGIRYGTVRRRLLEHGVPMNRSRSLSVKHKGRPSHRRGTKVSAESLERMSSAARARDPATRFGYRFTPEQRAKMREARLKYLASNPAAVKRLAELNMARAEANRETFEVRARLRRKMKSWVRRLILMPRIREERRYEKLLGYTKDQLREHLEKQFSEGMSWAIRESFHIDHVVPIVAFMRHGVTDPKIINALVNLQVLLPVKNREKSDNYDDSNFEADLRRIASHVNGETRYMEGLA